MGAEVEQVLRLEIKVDGQVYELVGPYLLNVFFKHHLRKIAWTGIFA